MAAPSQTNLVTLRVTPESRSGVTPESRPARQTSGRVLARLRRAPEMRLWRIHWRGCAALRRCASGAFIGAAEAALQDPEGPFQGPRGAPERRLWRLAALPALR